MLSDTKTIINISTNEQKKDWFLKLNPNGMSFQELKDFDLT